MLEAGLVSLLTADGGLSALIAGRIYPATAPENPTYPYLIYQVVSSRPEYALDGSQCGWKRIQFDVWGQSYSDCRNTLKALRNALDTYSGALVDGTRVLDALRSTEIDQFENDSRSFRSIAEYELRFVEA